MGSPRNNPSCDNLDEKDHEPTVTTFKFNVATGGLYLTIVVGEPVNDKTQCWAEGLGGNLLDSGENCGKQILSPSRS